MVRRLLLFAALLFGIFAMHTLGHPAMPEMQGMPGMSTAAGAGAAPATGARTATGATTETGAALAPPAPSSAPVHEHRTPPSAPRHEQRTPPSAPRHAHPAPPSVTVHSHPAPPSAQDSARGRHPQPAHSMDPLSVCLAVLGAGGAALLAALGLALESAGAGAVAALAAPLARQTGAARPVPPPLISLSVARLSVSRI